MNSLNKYKIFPALALTLAIISTTALIPSEPLPFNTQLKKSIEDTFFMNGQRSLEKIDAYETVINERYDQVKRNLKNVYTLEKKNSPKKAEKKIENKSETQAYEILLDYIHKLKQTNDPTTFQRLALNILRLDYALKIQARKLSSVELIEKIPFSLTSKKIPIRRAPNGEASNLVNPENGLFYSRDELERFKHGGGDVSKLNPPSDGTFWTNHAVSHINVREYYTNGGDPLHNGLEIVFPETKAYYDGVRKTQSKPKLDLYIHHNGEKLDFKMKVGAEVHSETTCAALYTALGFSADSTKYVRDFKVVLGDVTYHEFRKEWKSYYSGYNPDKYIKEKGKDDEGNYIVFHHGVLESKPPELIRVGSWAYGGNGNGGMREVRASLLFNMWVSNLDLKESENNKLILRKMGNDYRFFHIQHDMGFAFGKTFHERPGSFLWDLVKKRTDNYIHFNFNCLVDNSLFDNITYSDARWMARLIAHLTREQITDAVALGGWPEPLQKLLVEKLISRRNQLVRVFGLTGEQTPEGSTISLMKFDRRLSTPDGVVKDGKLKVYEFDGYPQYFGPRANEIIALILKGLRNMAVDSAVNIAGSVRYIVINPEWFGLDERIISKIYLRMDREIEQNPNPANESESFLVKDSMQIGLRLGYGSVLSGDVVYARKYTLVYPVESRDAGRFHGNFIMDLLLPLNYNRKTPNDTRVLMLEDFIEGRGKLRLRTLDNILEFALTASKIYLRRQYIGFKNDGNRKRAVYFKDKSLHDELKFRVFFEFLETFRSTPFYSHLQKGKLDRDFIELETTDLETNPEKQEALEQFLLEGDPDSLRKQGQAKNIVDHFLEKKIYLKILGLLRSRSVYRVDHVKETPSPQSPGRDHEYVQVESRRLNSWQFLDNGERRFSSIRLTGDTTEPGKIKEPLVTILFQVNDRSTHDGELKKGYLHFINTLALNKDFIRFDSSRHTANGLWGNTQTVVNVSLYREAIENLINADESTILNALSEVTGKPAEYWQKKAKPRFRKGRPIPGYASPDHYLAAKTRYFIRELRRARNAKNPIDQMEHLVKALRKSVYTSGQTFNPTLPAVVHKLAGKGNVFIKARVAMPDNKELIFPAGAPLYNESGKDRSLKQPEFQFSFDDPSEIYQML